MDEKIITTSVRGPADLIADFQSVCKVRDVSMSQQMRKLMRDEVRAARASGELPSVGRGLAETSPASDEGW